jgi:hypothetical protein
MRNRVEERQVRLIARQECRNGQNGIGKPFALRPRPDWKALLAFQYNAQGKRVTK